MIVAARARTMRPVFSVRPTRTANVRVSGGDVVAQRPDVFLATVAAASSAAGAAQTGKRDAFRRWTTAQIRACTVNNRPAYTADRAVIAKR